MRRKVYEKVSQACLNESFRTPPCIGMVPIPLLGRMTCVQEDSRLSVLDSGCTDCVLARKDVQAFGNLGEMRKKAVRPDSEFLQRSQLCAARGDRLSTVSSFIAVRREVPEKTSQACLYEFFLIPPCIGMAPSRFLDARRAISTALYKKNRISGVHHAEKYG